MEDSLEDSPRCVVVSLPDSCQHGNGRLPKEVPLLLRFKLSQLLGVFDDGSDVNF